MEYNDDRGDLLGENHDSFIVSQITEQFGQLRRLSVDLQNAFLRWISIRSRTMQQLEELATKLHKITNIAAAAGATMGSVGGILSVAGLIATPLTLGVVGSIAATMMVAGASIGGAGAFVLSGSPVVEALLLKLGLKDVQAAIEKDREACTELQQQLDSLENFVHGVAEFLKPLPADPMLLRPLEGSGFEFLRERIAFEDVGSSTEGKGESGARFLRDVTSAATISASAAAGSVVSAALLNLDITLLVKSSLELHRGSTSRAVEDIRRILNELECPDEEEIQGLVESFIDKKFTEAYNKTDSDKQGKNQIGDADDGDFDDDAQYDGEMSRATGEKQRLLPKES